MRKILVTGAGGFIGKNLIEQLGPYYKVWPLTSSELNLLDEIAVKSFLQKSNFDVVIHTATHNATVKSTKDLTLVLRNNLQMYTNLYRCRGFFGKMIYYGSGAEYDSRHYVPKMSEEYFDKHVPDDDYGFSKYIMNILAQKTDNIINIRAFGVYGKYEDWRIRFISNACCKAIFNMPITINQNIYFDYLYIDDLVKITKWFIDSSPRFHDYNICTGVPIDLVSIANMIKEISKKNMPIIIKTPGLKKEYSGNNLRLLSEIGSFHFSSIEKNINYLMEWYESNKDTINTRQLI